MAREGLRLAILAIAVISSLLQFTSAKTTHIVGDELGWIVPPGGPIAYEIWAETQTFIVGDILVFNFTNGEQDVARVTKEAFKKCNSTDPISLNTTSPVNFTLDKVGEYYFIGTKDRRCKLGQKLAINVTANPGPTPSPTPRGPVTYTVGDGLGWIVPPAGAIAYEGWAYDKTFQVGDTLVFKFENGTQDVAEVTKSAYRNCSTNNSIAVYSSSPVNIKLKNTGEYYFTSTYKRHCELGQRLTIHVITGGSTAEPPSNSIEPPSKSISPSSPSTYGPTSGGPNAPPPASSAPTRTATGFFGASLLVVFAFFH